MQFIDNWIGLPLAWLMGLFIRGPRCLAGDAHPTQPVKRVIVLKWVGLGSIVLSLPLLQEMKKRGVEIAFWTLEGHESALELSGLVDHVWVVRKKAWMVPISIIMAVFAARRFKADAVFDLEPTSNGTACIARLTGAPVVTGFMVGKKVRERLFTHLVALTAGRHMAENCVLMARSVGITMTGPPRLPEIRLPAAVKTNPERIRIVMNTNTSDLGRELRRWPDLHWVELANRLLENPAVDLSFTGIKSEYAGNEQIIEKIRAERGRVTNLAGKTSIHELLSYLKSADLVVSVDSGVMHLAAWSGAPLIGLFGADTPTLYGPLSLHSQSIWQGLPCSPCCTVVTEKHTQCRDNRCMQEISPSRVRLYCEELIKRGIKVRAREAA